MGKSIPRQDHMRKEYHSGIVLGAGRTMPFSPQQWLDQNVDPYGDEH